MMSNPEMTSQMQRMMENCIKMIKTLMQRDQTPPQPQDKKGFLIG